MFSTVTGSAARETFFLPQQQVVKIWLNLSEFLVLPGGNEEVEGELSNKEGGKKLVSLLPSVELVLAKLVYLLLWKAESLPVCRNIIVVCFLLARCREKLE